MTLEGWHVDQLDPRSFFQLLDGTTIRPANNTNFAYFNDPEYNRRIAEVDAMPSPARESAFGLLDAEIARDAAPWAAYAVPNDRYYFSDRVGCQLYAPAYTLNLAALCLRPAISIGDATIEEGNGGTRVATFSIQIAESAPADFPVSVDYSTSDGTADSSDYRPVTGTVTFESAEAKTITVDVTGDTTHRAGRDLLRTALECDEGDDRARPRLSEPSRTTMPRHLRRLRRLPRSIRRHLPTRVSGARATRPAWRRSIARSTSPSRVRPTTRAALTASPLPGIGSSLRCRMPSRMPRRPPAGRRAHRSETAGGGSTSVPATTPATGPRRGTSARSSSSRGLAVSCPTCGARASGRAGRSSFRAGARSGGWRGAIRRASLPAGSFGRAPGPAPGSVWARR